MLTLADAIEALTNIRLNADAVITEAIIDSRQAIPGSLFVAVPGERLDGHDFIEDAFKRGASFALIQREANASFRTLDLRNGLSINSKPDVTLPLCLRVDNTITALQQIARFWRRKLNLPRDRDHRQCRQIHNQRNHCPGVEPAILHTQKSGKSK